MNQKRSTIVRSAASLALGLGMLAALLFSTTAPAYAGTGGVSIVSVTVGGPSGSVTYGTPGNVSYLVTATCAGTGGGNTWAPIVSSSLPAGVTASFSPTPLTWANNCGSTLSQNTTLTLHTTAASPGGVFNFTVQVGQSSGNGSLTVHGIALTVQGFAASSRQYDGTTAAAISSFGTLSTGVISPDVVFLDHSSAGASFSDKFVGSGKVVTAYGYALTGANASNYTLVQPTTFADITKRDLHIFLDSATSRQYDGTTDVVVSLSTDKVLGDSVTPSGTGQFDTKNVGTGKTVTVPSVSLSGPDAANYNVVTSTASGTANITARPITVAAVSCSKQYDGGTVCGLAPQITVGSLASGDTANFSESFDNKNVGTLKTLTVGGAVSDLNGGNNYAVTKISNPNGEITLRPITVSAIGVNKAYDGSSSATVTLSDTRVLGDVLSDSYISAAFTGKNVGAGKTISVSGISISGTDAANYSLQNTTATTSADISPRLITVTAQPNSKPYDGGFTAAALPLITNGSLALGDTASFSESYQNRNVGANKTLVPSGSVVDGNGGGNYGVNFVNDNSGEITLRPLTVTAIGVDKVYDGSAAATVTLGDNRVAGDLLSDSYLSASFADKNVGSAKNVSVSGISISGTDAGNYSLSNSTASSTAAITQRAITVTANSDSRIYDGGVSSSVAPSVTLGVLQGSDTPAFSQSFNNRHVGSGKLLSPAGAVNDGNGGANYAVTFQPMAVGQISVRSITVTAQSDTKVYDGTVASSVSPLITSGSLAGADSASWSQTFDSKNAGTGKTLTPAGSVNDGNGGNDYSVSFVGASGVIEKRAITSVTAENQEKADTDILPATFPFHYAQGDILAGDSADDIDTKPVCAVYIGGVLQSGPLGFGSYPITCSGGSDNNYSFGPGIYHDGTLLVDLTNQAPTEIYLAGHKDSEPLQKAEFQAADTLMGYLTADDPDNLGNPNNDPATFSLVPSCGNNDMFQVGGTDNEELRLANSPAYGLDYETQPVLHVCVRATDSHSSYIERTFEIDVTNKLGGESYIPSVGVADGTITESVKQKGVGGATNAGGATLLVGASSTNLQYRSILSFNTSSPTVLPKDAVLTRVILKLPVQAVQGDPTQLGNLLVDLKQGNFGLKSTLEPGDFQDASAQLNFGTLSGTPQAGQWYLLNIDPASLNTTKLFQGITQFRLRFEKAGVDHPNGKANALAFYSGNYSKSSLRPQLYIEYSRPSAPATFPSIATYDGQIMESGLNSNAGGALNAGGPTLAVGDAKAGQAYRSILSFNTALLPDRSIITGAFLQLTRKSQTGKPFDGHLGDLVVDLKQPNFGSKITLESADFANPTDPSQTGVVILKEPTSGNLNQFTVPLDPSIFSGSTNNMVTQFRLGFSRPTGDDSNGIADTVFFFSGSGGAGAPKLIITFTIP